MEIVLGDWEEEREKERLLAFMETEEKDEEKERENIYLICFAFML